MSSSFFEILNKKLEEAAEKKSSFHFHLDYYSNYSSSICKVAKHPKNLIKNQGNHWGFPYDHNLITSIPEYINASPMNFANRRYIAAQGPRSHTFNAFWQMIAAEKVSRIVSVTNEIEAWEGKLRLKFARFWPNTGIEKFGEFSIELLKDELIEEWNDGRLERIKRRDLQFFDGNTLRQITHFHMENWPDNGVVHPESLFALANHVDTCKKDEPMLVHCAAGIGRTGTFIAFHSLYREMLEQLSRPSSPFDWDVAERVKMMRKLRWGAVVADIKQYELLVEALHLALAKLQ